LYKRRHGIHQRVLMCQPGAAFCGDTDGKRPSGRDLASYIFHRSRPSLASVSYCLVNRPGVLGASFGLPGHSQLISL